MQAWIHFWMQVVKIDPTLFAYFVTTAETALALALIFGVLSNLAYLGGSVLALMMWSRANPVIPLIAIGLDVIILGAFVLMKFQNDPLVIFVSLFGFAAILVAQRLFMITHTDPTGLMYMEMEMSDGENIMPPSGEKKMPDDMDM